MDVATGVYLVELGIALNLTEPDLGHPSMQDLWDRLHGNTRKGQLQCLECRERKPDCPEWMYLRVRRGRREAVHLNPTIGEHDSAESDEHKALKERIARAAVNGGFEAMIEDRAQHGRRRTDVLVRGRGIELGFEAQLAPISSSSVRRRSNIAVADGITPVWTTTDRRANVIDRAPWARIDRVPWHAYLSDTQLPVRGGVRGLVIEQCSRLGLVCPDKKARRKCSGWHGRWEPRELRSFDDLVVRAASREYLSLKQQLSKQRAYWFWAPATDVAKLVPIETDSASPRISDGGTATVASTPRPLDRVCHYNEEILWEPTEVPEEPTVAPVVALARPVRTIVLDWSKPQHFGVFVKPCRICGNPAFMRDDDGRPCHKTCAESLLTANR
jgi:hypothetical protein